MNKPDILQTSEARVRVDVVIPVYNEEKILAQSIATLHNFLRKHKAYGWRIVIADNASTDSTAKIARALAGQYNDVQYLRLPYKGRGRALRHAWLNSDAEIVSYMDVDLSTDLNCLMPMIEKLASDEAEIAIGSRYQKGAQVTRGLKREFFSRSYMALIKLFFACNFSDAQCGFKAATRHAVQKLVPLVENQGWFFDAEFLLLAEHYGLPIFQMPVRWVDDPDSRVKLTQTISEHFVGLVRMRLAFSTGFAAVPANSALAESYA